MDWVCVNFYDNGGGSHSGSDKRLFPGQGRCCDHEDCGHPVKYSGPSAGGFAAGSSGKGQCLKYFICHWDHRMDEYGQGGTHGSASDQKQ